MHRRLPSTLARRCGRPGAPLARYTYNHTGARQLSLQSFVPRVFSPSWWSRQLPKDLFTPRPSSAAAARPWNPAWGFIILALFVGSQSLNIIALRQEAAVFVRRSDARIRTLQEIVRKIQDGDWAADGEEVRKALRLGKDARDDREWEDVMGEIENEDAKWQAEVQRQRELLEQQEAERTKFAALESPTAAWTAGQKNKKKVTADDYLV